MQNFTEVGGFQFYKTKFSTFKQVKMFSGSILYCVYDKVDDQVFRVELWWELLAFKLVQMYFSADISQFTNKPNALTIVRVATNIQ